VALHRGFDGTDPARREPVARVAGPQEERRNVRTSRLAGGTLACPACDAPVSPGPRSLSPAEAIACPYCAHAANVRDFLSLTAPSRPAHVEVRVVERPGASRRYAA
jgi:hypothetical protein